MTEEETPPLEEAQTQNPMELKIQFLEEELKEAKDKSGKPFDIVQLPEETRNWAQGFQMILNQFLDVLSNQGITSFHAMGTPFDPHLHYAIETEETTEHPEGTILQEFVKGYKSGDRPIRPARVKVAKAPQNT